MSVRRSISSTTGSRVAKESWIRVVSRPRAPNVVPLMALTMPVRWSALTAFGEAKLILPRSSTTITPSPTLGECPTGRSSSAKGKMPSVTMSDNRSKRSR